LKKFGFWWLIIAVALFGLVFGVFLTKPYTPKGSVIDPAVPAPSFSLQSSQGNNFNLEEHQGKYVLLFFGYTYCPDVCPTTLYEMKEIKNRLKEKSDHIEFVFITVDPARDTKDQLSRYLSSFDDSFYGLTGDESTLSKVWRDYGVFREIQSTENSSNYLVDHSARLYLIDSQSQLISTYLIDMPLDDLVGDMQYFINQEF
jgi:protein SCO1/2